MGGIWSRPIVRWHGRKVQRSSRPPSASCPYAVEDGQDHLTLDAQGPDTGKTLPHAVLEFKSTKPDKPPDALTALHLRPIKLSKFLWATEV